MSSNREFEFKDWLKKVDDHIDNLCGLTHMDIGDQTWADWFESGMSPEEAATDALENEGFPFED